VRVFSAIALPAVVRDHLAGALAMTGGTTGAPWDPVENWHITLGFYGEVPAARVEEISDAVAAVAARTPPFSLALAGAGTFRQDVCWIGVADPDRVLPGLAAAVRADFATSDQHAHNRFHVTISRSGRRAGLAGALAALAVYRGPTWTVDRLVVYRSDLGEGTAGHPLYTVLSEHPLG